MANNKHLSLSDRITIESMLEKHHTFKEIGSFLDKDPTTISKEIRSRFVTLRTGGRYIQYNNCQLQFSCSKKHLCHPCHSSRKFKLCRNCSMCNTFCDEFIPDTCPKHSKPPYVCNGCGKRYTCSLEKHLYIAKDAHSRYRTLLSESRTGISFSEEEIKHLDDLITPLIKKGQSPHHICATNRDSIMVSERTIYRFVDSRIFSAMNLDLPRKVRYSARKKAVHVKVDKACRINRTYEDFKTFMKAINTVNVYLCRRIAGDGEGATKLIECKVTGAKTLETAKTVAKSVICSSLTKAAMFGSDANWGRVLCAIGYSGAAVDVNKIDVAFKSPKGEIAVCKNGAGIPFSEEKAKEILLESEIEILVELNSGEYSSCAWGCDLTYDYVKINGDYRT